MLTGLLDRDRDFRRFWAGQTVSVVGTQVSAVALPLVAALTLGSGAGGVSALATAAYLPNVALPLLAGAWLEARAKRPAMIAADVVRAAALAVVPCAYAVDRLSLGLLVGVALVVGCASVVFDVAGFAFVPSLVDPADLAAANRAMQGSVTAAQIGGPGAAGLLVQVAGPVGGVVVDALSYVASVVGLVSVRKREPVLEPPTRRVAITAGLVWIWRNPYLRALSVHAAVYNCASQIFTVNLVVYAIHRQGLTAGAYGAALTAGGAGAFIGTMAALRAARLVGYGRAFVASLVFSTGLPIAIAILPGAGTTFAVTLGTVLLLSGIGLGSANVLSITLRQALTPGGSLARTNGGYRLLIFGVLPVGSVLGGLVGSVAGSRVGVAAGAVGLLLSAAPMAQRRIRNLEDPHQVREDGGRPEALPGAAPG